MHLAQELGERAEERAFLRRKGLDHKVGLFSLLKHLRMLDDQRNHILERWKVKDILQNDIEEAVVVATIVAELYDFLLEIDLEDWSDRRLMAAFFSLKD